MHLILMNVFSNVCSQKCKNLLFFQDLRFPVLKMFFSRDKKNLDTSHKKAYKSVKHGSRNFNNGLNVTPKLNLLETDHKTQLT